MTQTFVSSCFFFSFPDPFAYLLFIQEVFCLHNPDHTSPEVEGFVAHRVLIQWIFKHIELSKSVINILEVNVAIIVSLA